MHTPALQTKKNIRGFTLVETIVVTALFSILTLAIAGVVHQFYRSNAYAIAQSAEVQSASRGIKLLVRDIREATFAENGSYPIVEAATSTLSLYSDIDRDENVEHISYVLEGLHLFKYVTNPTGSPPSYATTTPDETILISDYVRNTEQSTSTFRYFDDSGSEVDGSNVTEIASVRIQVIVNVDPNKSPGLFTLRSHATLRNLKDNL